MPRHKQFGDVIESALNEARMTTNAARGVDFREHVRQSIRSTQEFYYGEYNWPFMKIKRENAGKILAAGQRYYDFPATLNQDKSFKLWYFDDSVWIPLKEGITPADYSQFDSDNDERSSPVLKWAKYGETQFEVWPLPIANGAEVRFEGMKALTLLTADSSLLDLDDMMIYLSVAADISETNNQKLSAQLRSRAERRYWQQRGDTAVDLNVQVGLNGENKPPPPQDETGWPRMIAVYNDRD